MADKKPIVFDTTDNVYALLNIDENSNPDTLLTKDIELDSGQLRLNKSHREAIQFSRLYGQGPTTQGISWGQIKPDGTFERQWELMKVNSYDFVINQTGHQITGLGTEGTAADTNEAFRIKYNNNLATFGGDIKIKGDRITVHSSGNTYDHKLEFTTPTDHRTITFQDGSGTVAFLSDAPATNLSYTASTRLLESSTGTDVTLPEVVAGGNSGLITGADKTKIDGIEAGATGDQTAAEIRTLVDAASDSNVFTDADHSKLDGIESGATGDQTAAEIRTLVDAASDSNVFTDADHSKLDGIESGATADQTAAEIRTLVDSATDSNVFTDADHTKLDGIASGAEVNVATDLSYTASTRLLASSTGSDVTLPEVVASGNSGLITGADKSKLDGVEAGATADQTAAEIRTLVDAASDSNVFTDADHTKLDGIAAGAEVNVATNLSYTSSSRELASSTGTNVTLPEVSAGGDSGLMTGADKTKLDGLQSGQGSTNLTYTASTRVIASSSGTDATLPNVSAGGDSGLMTGADKTKLDGINADDYLKSNADDTYTGIITGNRLILGGSALNSGSAAKLQVNGFMRTGAIYVHDTTNNTDAALSNTNNVLFWNSHKLWHAGNDGATSGLNADLLDGEEGSYYTNAGNLTGSPTFTSTTTTNVFFTNDSGDNPKIKVATGSFGSVKVSNYGKGGWLGYAIEEGAVFMQNSTSTDFGLYDDTNNHWALKHTKNGATALYYDGTSKIQTTSGGVNVSDTAAATSFAVANGGTITDSTGNYGSIKVTGGSTGGWKGYAIEDGAVFMQNDAGTVFGLYDDTNNHWAVYHAKNAETRLYYNNSNKLQTTNTGVNISGSLTVDGGTCDGEWQVNGRLDVGIGNNGDHEIRIFKQDNGVADHIQFYNGTTRVGEIGCEDTSWLRINQETNKNIYTPRYIRADNGFFIDGTSYGIAGDAEVRAKGGSATDPGITFGNDTDTGIYRNGSNKISFCSNGVRRCDMSSGNFTFPGIWNNTTSSGSTCRVTNGGRLRRQGSSRKYKTNIEPMDYAYCDNLLDNAEPIWYRPRIPDPEFPQEYLDWLTENYPEEQPEIGSCDDYCKKYDVDWEVGDKWMNEGENPTHSKWGFIAEDLALIDPRFCVQGDEEGEWVGVNYDEFTPMLVRIAQEQRSQIKSLEERLAALEASSNPTQ